MPSRSKIDRLPDALKTWLRAELNARGYSDYDGVTAALNERMAEAGLDLVISRTGLGRWSQAQKKYADIQREADGWAQSFLSEEGVDAEAHRHRVLFSMLSHHAFLTMANGLTEGDEKEELDFDARDLHFLGRMLKDLMTSSGIREAIGEKERRRLAEAERKAGADRAVSAARGAGLSPEVAAAIRAAVEGGAQAEGAT